MVLKDLKIELTEKENELKEAISNSTTDIVVFDDVEINKNTAIELKNGFSNFLNSDSTKFKRIFIPIKLINKNDYWKKLQASLNELYDAN